MCCCGKPTVNGELGYRWNDANATPSTYPVNPPTIDEQDELLYDDPGRCGGLDAHSHHYRVVKRYGSLFLLVKHGGGQERIRLSCTPSLRETLAALDSTNRYWLLHTIRYAHSDGSRDAEATECARWQTAAAERRIKVRKLRGRDACRVSITPKTMQAAL
jgi:hypothetical protein